jgi:hypothetical protein
MKTTARLTVLLVCLFTSPLYAAMIKDSVARKLHHYIETANYQAINAMDLYGTHKYRRIVLIETGMMLRAYLVQSCYPRDVRYRNYLARNSSKFFYYVAQQNKALWLASNFGFRSKIYWQMHNQILVYKCHSQRIQKKLLNLIDYFNVQLGKTVPGVGNRHVAKGSVYARLSSACYIYKRDYQKLTGYYLRDIRSWCNCMGRTAQQMHIPPHILKPYTRPKNFNGILVTKHKIVYKVINACVRR